MIPYEWCDDHQLRPVDCAHLHQVAEKPEPQAGSAKRSASAPGAASTLLVELAASGFTFHISTDGEPFAVPRIGPRIVRLVRGRHSLRALLAREYFAVRGRAAPQQALVDALGVITGMAENSEPLPLHLRVAEHGGRHYLDLGDLTGRGVELGPDGCRVVDQVPVLFRRTALSGTLPVPVHGGDVAELWDWVNVEKEDRPLLIAWLVSVLLPDIPHPVLGLFGEQGTGKSTAARILSLILDSSPVPLRKAPRDSDSWVTAASGSWVVAVDNISDISDWFSDSLCRASTGDGDVRRQLYTDGDLVVFSFRRCVLINGIDVGAVRGDLADRLLGVTLVSIPSDRRRTEEDIWRGWEEAHPRILGALLGEAARIIRVLPSVRLGALPRMADFGRVVAAVDEVLGTDGSARYAAKATAWAADSLSGNPFIVAMLEGVAEFEGTSGELLASLTPVDEKWRAPKGWPTGSREVTKLLHRHGPALRAVGWSVQDLGADNKSHATRWLLSTLPKKARNSSSPSSPSSPTSVEASGEASGEAGLASGEAGLASGEAGGEESLVSVEASGASMASRKYEQSKEGSRVPCDVCGEPLDPVLAAYGETNHSACEIQL